MARNFADSRDTRANGPTRWVVQIALKLLQGGFDTRHTKDNKIDVTVLGVYVLVVPGAISCHSFFELHFCSLLPFVKIASDPLHCAAASTGMPKAMMQNPAQSFLPYGV